MATSSGRRVATPSVARTVHLIREDDVPRPAAGYRPGREDPPCRSRACLRPAGGIAGAGAGAADRRPRRRCAGRAAQLRAGRVPAHAAGLGDGPVSFRHKRPVSATLVGSVVWLIPTDGYLYLGYVAALLLYYSLAVEVDDFRAVAAVAVAGCALGASAVLVHHDVLGELFGSVLIVVAPVAVGRIVRRERLQQRRLEDLTLHLERERERGARAAVAEERARIARELHDVVAHGVSVIAIQSDAAEAALERDPSLAR